jgi:hypothetical protein
MFTLSVFISRLEYSSLSIFPRQSWIHQWGHVFWEFHAHKQSDICIHHMDHELCHMLEGGDPVSFGRLSQEHSMSMFLTFVSV